VAGYSSYTWASSTGDVRGLQKALASDRIAATWYADSMFSIDLDLTDGLTHQIALYCVDWDTNARIETLDIVDASKNVVLDTRNLSSFQNGEYLVWNITGHVKINVSKNGGVNAVVSGLYFGGAASPAP